jgi:hypothetical protein
MCMGRISTKWALAAAQYNTLPTDSDVVLHWASILIAALWRFSKSLWQHRNGIVHGATVEEQALRKLQSVRERITTFYNSYSENHKIVLPRHKYLFHNRTLEERLGASFDNMSAWIRSVEEAMLVLQHQEASHQADSQLIFPHHPLETHSADSGTTYSLSSIATSVSTTLATTTTMDTSTTTSTAASTKMTNYVFYDSEDERICSDVFSLTDTLASLSDSTRQVDTDTDSVSTHDTRDTNLSEDQTVSISTRGFPSVNSSASWEVT